MANNVIDIVLSAKDAATKEIKTIYGEIGTLNNEIQVQDKQWKALSISTDKAKQSTKLITDQKKHLETQLQNVQAKAQLLNAVIEKSKTAEGENTKETERLRVQLASLGVQEAKLKNQMDQVTQSIDNNSNVFKRQSDFLTKHRSTIMGIGAAAGVAFGALALGVKDVTRENMELSNSLIGLTSIAEGFGVSADAAKKAAMDLSADGLMTVAEAATSLKNLLSRGFSLPEATDMMNRFKDSAAFGRQASLGFGQAIMGATEGIKNENSVLVDNAGVTKNVSKMWEDYAKQIGKSVKDLTKAEKLQAEYNGIMEETRFQVGDAAKLSEELSGKLSELTAETRTTKAAIGEALEPTLKNLVGTVTKVVGGFGNLIKEHPKATAGIIGVAMAGTGAVTALAGIGLIIPNIIKGYQLLSAGLKVARNSQLAMNLAMMMNPIGLVVAAIAALIGGLVYLYKTNDTARYYMNMAWNSIKIAALTSVNGILFALKHLLSFIPGMADKIQGYRDKIGNIIDGEKAERESLIVNRALSKDEQAMNKLAKESGKLENQANKTAKATDDLTTSTEKNTSATDKQKEAAEKLNEAIQKQQKIYDIAVDKINQFGSEITKALKNRYEKEEKLQTEAIETRISNAKEAADREIDEIDRVLDERIKAIDIEAGLAIDGLTEKIDAIDAQIEAEEKALKEQQYQKELAEKLKAVTEAKSAEDRAKATEDYNDLIADHERDLLLEQRQIQKDALRAQIEEIRKNADEQKELEKQKYAEIKKAAQDAHETKLNNLTNELTATKAHYVELLKEESLQAEARLIMLGKSNDNLIELLSTYNPKWQNAGQSFAESLVLGLNSQKTNVTTAVNELLGMVNQANAAAINLATLTGTEKPGAVSTKPVTPTQTIKDTPIQSSDDFLQGNFGKISWDPVTKTLIGDGQRYSINSFGDGGEVPGPTGSAQLAVVHGGETVLPTHKKSALPSKQEFHFHFHGAVYGLLDFEQTIKKIILEAIRQGAFRGLLPSV